MFIFNILARRSRYVGCHHDLMDGTRVLPLVGYNLGSDANSYIGPESAVTHCAAWGMRYAGTQHGQAEMCGDNYQALVLFLVLNLQIGLT